MIAVTGEFDRLSRIRATRFRDERAKVPESVELPLAELVPRHIVRDSKAGTGSYSGAVYKAGAMRGNRGVEAMTLLVYDYDHKTPEVAREIVGALREARAAYLMATTSSHVKDGPDDCCLRVVLVPSRPIKPAEYEAVWTEVNLALGRHADPQAKDLARMWYVPSCPAERQEAARYELRDGGLVDVDAILASSMLAPKGRKSRSRRATPSKEGPITEGARHGVLVQMAGAMRRRGMGREAIEVALRSVNRERCVPPMDEAEVDAIAASVSEYDPTDPLLVHHLTDLGNAERLEHRVGDALLYVHLWKSWIWWDGRRYIRDTSGEALRQAGETIRAMLAAADTVTDPAEHDRLVKHAMESESAARLNGMLQLATSRLPVAVEALETRPMLFNVRNGTIDLTTGALRTHDRADRLMKLAPVDFDPAATCPKWLAFLERVTGGSEALIAFLQRAVGYSLTGDVREQVLLVLYGTGANGKSTFLETLRGLIGDYFLQADFTTFTARREGNEGPRNDLARLAGARMVAAVETEAGSTLAEATVKQVTGGDTITARFLYGEFFDFMPAFKLWLAANHKPNIRGGDEGIWRRIRLVPFTVTIPEAERDKGLPAALRAELPGILNWAIAGCLAWQKEGLGYPSEVRDATAAYRDEMDVFGDFLAARCVVGPAEESRADVLLAAYEGWRVENGERELSPKGFGKKLSERGFQPFKATKGVRSWRGLRVRTSEDPE